MKRSLPVDSVDWDELFFMAHKFLGLSMNEFLFDYNLELVSYMINKHIELKTGANLNSNDSEQKPTEARSFFSELGF